MMSSKEVQAEPAVAIAKVSKVKPEPKPKKANAGNGDYTADSIPFDVAMQTLAKCQ